MKNQSPSDGQSTAFWGLLRHRQCWLPTWRGWMILLLSSMCLAFLAARQIHPFLAVNDPLPGGLLVVEGWAPDAGMEFAIAEFRTHHYEKLLVTGGPLEQGALLSEYRTLAELGTATLVRLGMNSNAVQAVPAPHVRRDRTYACALALKLWLKDHGLSPDKVNLITGGPHARRSRLLFRKALGDGVAVGVIAVPVHDYDPERWWRSSLGIRVVIGEIIAYCYARVLGAEEQ